MSKFTLKKIFIIIFYAVLGMLAGALFGYFILIKYKSISIISFDMKSYEYRKFIESVSNVDNLNKYIELLNLNKTDYNLVLELKQTVLKQSKWVEPMQRLSRQDIKEFGDTNKTNDESAIFGLKYTGVGKTPEIAQQLAQYEADYAMYSGLRVALVEHIRNQIATKASLIEVAESEKIHLEHEISTTTTRLKELRRISQLYPDAAKIDSRQLISIDKGGERYMPITNQMVALETQVVDIKERISQFDRNLKIYPVELALLKEQLAVLDKTATGKDTLDAIMKLAQQKFVSAKEEWEKQIYLDSLSVLGQIRSRYLDKPSFLVSPTLPESPEQPKPIILGILFALLFGALAAAWQFRETLKQFLRDETSAPLNHHNA